MHYLRLDTRLCDEGFQNASICVLGISEIQDLIQQLVDENKIVLDVLFRDFAKVGLHDSAHLQ